MSRKLFGSLMAVAAMVGMAGTAQAQGAAKSKRVAVAVMDFDYGTVGYHWWGDYDIGKGMADQVVDELVNDGTFRVIERKKLDTVLAEQDFSASDRAAPSASKLSKIGKVLGIRYIIAGSITKFGGEDNRKGGSLKGIHLGVGKAKTEVNVTARLIDTSTGEIMASAKGAGLSKKGGGFSFGKGGTSFNQHSSDFRSSAIGEAQEAACKALVAQILTKKDRLE